MFINGTDNGISLKGTLHFSVSKASSSGGKYNIYRDDMAVVCRHSSSHVFPHPTLPALVFAPRL